MTSNSNVSSDTPVKDVSSTSPLRRHTTPRAVSGSNTRYSVESNETGESSKAASRRSVASSNDSVVDKMQGKDDTLEAADPSKDGRGSHRSHRNRNSGGFLLSSTAFDPPANDAATAGHIPHRRQSSRDQKSKAVVGNRERGHTKRRSYTGLGLGIGSSPLGATVTTAGTDNGTDGEKIDPAEDTTSTEPKIAGLDVDSTQIVNLALNLSESRRIAARRSGSSTTPPVASAFRESFVGGNLRQHLQQQRRSSRNPSPKAERGDRALTASPRIVSGQKMHSPLNSTFDNEPEEDYRYRFTASTLARAEKAKNLIGLMVEYRRLLQYVPPLKPQGLDRLAASDSPRAALLTPPRTQENITLAPRQLGREYNPLQYVRNRKVRARERKAIDGEAQGFGDLAKVSSWVDDVAARISSEDYRAADCLPMPPFSKAAEAAASPRTPPQSKSQTVTPKIKRPRIDWVTNPADMLADVFWLEQDDNKKIIEDHYGRKIFSRSLELKRPVSHKEDAIENEQTSELGKVGSPNLRIDTKLPEFHHSKGDSTKHRHRATSRAKQKLREVTRLHHGHNGSVRERPLLRLRGQSESDSSGTDGAHRPRRSRRHTTEAVELGTDILEKQMMEMLEKEATSHEWSVQDKLIEGKPSVEESSVISREPSARNSRDTSLTTADSHQSRNPVMHTSSGRPSLEGPPGNPRVSLEELDSTAPNSPQAKASKAINAFVPSIAMDLSPPSHPTSPRHHLSRVRSRINPFEHSRTHSRGRGDTNETPLSAPSSGPNDTTTEIPDITQRRKRSLSPVSKVSTKKTDDSSKSAARSNIRRGRGEESTSIMGFLKGSRGPVAKVSDFLWKKEASPTLSIPPGFSSDESDSEELRAMQGKLESDTRDTSAELPSDDNDDALAENKLLPHNEKLPVFTSSSEHRVRPALTLDGDTPTDSGTFSERQAREERRRASPANFLEIPSRIDVQNASLSSSPDLQATRRYSSVSDLESRRGSAVSGVESADARLNAILGHPGRPGPDLPVTGLSSLGTSHDRRPTLDGKRQWSITDRELPAQRGPVSEREIARVRALLLSSGIKAKELSRRAAEPVDLQITDENPYSVIGKLANEKLNLVPNSQRHVLAARILSNDMQLSSRMWRASVDNFYGTTVSNLLDRVDHLHSSIADNLTPMVRRAADEADEVSRNILTFQTLHIKRIIDTMDNMMRRRRRRFRWLRRGGWVLVEWALVGVMWCAWFVVVFIRVAMGLGNAVVGSVRWLFWL